MDTNSERLACEGSKGKSAVWKQFHLISLDNVAVPFVKCDKCNSLLKWKSRDGTSGLTAHIDYCTSQVPQRKLTSVAGFSSMPSSAMPAAVKSDVTNAVVSMCAQDIRYVISLRNTTLHFIKIQPELVEQEKNVYMVWYAMSVDCHTCLLFEFSFLRSAFKVATVWMDCCSYMDCSRRYSGRTFHAATFDFVTFTDCSDYSMI